MKKTFRNIQEFAQAVATAWKNDRVLNLSASLAFYTILTIPPLIIALTSMTSAILGEDRVRSTLLSLSHDVLTPQSAELVQEVIDHVPPSSTHSLVAIFSTFVVLVVASGIFIHIKRALNVIWNIAPKERGFIKGFFLNRMLGFFMLVLLGTLFVGTVLAATLLSLSSELLAHTAPPGIIQLVSILLLAAVLLFFFTVIFTFLPDAKIEKKEAFVGAATSTILFIFGNFLLNMYLRRAGIVSIYGAAGSIIALLLWVYYSSATLFLGAEVAHVYAARHGNKITPAKGAKKIHTIRI